MKPIKLNKGEHVSFMWLDSCQQVGWGKSDTVELSIVFTNGWVVDTNQDGLAITDSFTLAGDPRSAISVPWFAIQKLMRNKNLDLQKTKSKSIKGR